MAVQNNQLFEKNENGERVLVKSIESVSRVYLRFTNQTTRLLNVSWVDFKGFSNHFKCMQPGTCYDIDSYLTHPWEFRDRATGEYYVINNKPVFRAPVNLGGTMTRTNFNITIGVRTLRHTALMCVASFIPHADNVAELELPLPLKDELYELVYLHNNLPPLKLWNA